MAAQDKAVQLGNQLAAIQRRVAEARRLVAKQRRAAARAAAQQSPPRTTTRVVQTAGFSLDSLCGPVTPRGNSVTARRLRKQHQRARKQALYQLNLSCPPTRS